ncbi:trace amine-associated receptor 11, partial [Silurus asotus]
LFTTIIILTVSGNLLVIFVILLSQNPLPAPTNHMILSLSIAGVLIGGLVLPNSMVRSIETCWYFGQILCEIHTTVDIVLCNTTVWHLTFISVDRYLAIFHPLHYRNLMTNKTGMAMISSSWSLALVFGFVIVISNPQVKIRGDLYKFCEGGCFSLHAREIGVEYSIIFYFIPVCTIIAVYSRIFFVAQRHAKVIHSYNKGPKPSAPLTVKDLKATKTLAVVVGTFLFCWTPFFMCNLIDPLIGHSINTLLYESFMWVAYLNAMFNPLIYVFFYGWFRKTARVLLSKLQSLRGVQKMNSTLSAALCYESLNNSCPRTVYPLVLHLSFYFLFTTIIILTVSGNLLVIFVILLSQNPLATSTNHMILSLSIAGVLIGGLVLPNSMVRSIETCWYFGQMLCEIHTTVDIVLCNTTVWHLTFISVDRYLAIFHPLHYQSLMTNKTGMAMISSSWSLALVFGFVIIISNPEVKIQSDLNESCVGGCDSSHVREIGVEYFIIFFLIPVCIIITVYSRIFFVAQRHAKVIHSYNKGPKPSAPLVVKDLKATKTLGIVVGTFLFCWTPIFMCNLFDPLIGHSINSVMYDSFMWFAYLNVMFNPLIYAFFYSWFRK